ncbi:hypothetical protein VTI28DRAFT_3667 [Corynascus sepedonium]
MYVHLAPLLQLSASIEQFFSFLFPFHFYHCRDQTFLAGNEEDSSQEARWLTRTSPTTLKSYGVACKREEMVQSVGLARKARFVRCHVLFNWSDGLVPQSLRVVRGCVLPYTTHRRLVVG